MAERSLDPGVFMWSMSQPPASRRGLSAAAPGCCEPVLCNRVDMLLVETVEIGENEVADITDQAGIRTLPRMPLHQPPKVPNHGLERVVRLARRILNLALDLVNASAAGDVPGAHVAEPDGRFLSDRFDICAGEGPTGERW